MVVAFVIVVGMMLTVGGSLRQSCGVGIGVVAAENGQLSGRDY